MAWHLALPEMFCSGMVSLHLQYINICQSHLSISVNTAMSGLWPGFMSGHLRPGGPALGALAGSSGWLEEILDKQAMVTPLLVWQMLPVRTSDIHISCSCLPIGFAPSI